MVPLLLEGHIQEGLLIFFNAVESFDPSKDVRLSTYAYSRIKFLFADLSRMYAQKIAFSQQESSNEFNPDYLMSEIDSETNVMNIRKALSALPDRQRLILEKKFGIQGKAQPISEIAKDFRVSCETIRKDKKLAILALSDSKNLQSLAS